MIPVSYLYLLCESGASPRPVLPPPPPEEGKRGRMAASTDFFCNRTLYSAMVTSCWAVKWGTSRKRMLSLLCKIQGGKAEVDHSNTGDKGSIKACKAVTHLFYTCWASASLWLSATDGSRRNQLGIVSGSWINVECTHGLKSPFLHGRQAGYATGGLINRALLYIKDNNVILLRSCLLIRSYIFHKDMSIDFGFLGVDN